MSTSFHLWLVSAWTNLLSWFGVEEQQLASFLYPVLKDAKQLIEHDLLKDIIAGVPVVASALAGGIPAALAAAEQFILPLLTAQGLELEQTTVSVLSNSLVAQAQASLDTPTVSVGA